MKRKMICLIVIMSFMIPLFSLTAAANDPPLPPEIKGPSSGKVGQPIEYEFCGEDPNGDDIQICVSWGDGTGETCYGPFPSGICIKLEHTWTEIGSYTITSYCTDTHEAKSDNTTKSISIEKSKNRFIQFNFILQLLQNFQMIRYLLGL